MHLPSLNALRAFDAVARQQSVSAAAATLAVTPSAVSRQISNLEEYFGVALLAHNGRGICLTADGRRLESGLADSFTQITVAVERFRQPARGNTLQIFAPPLFALGWLIPRLDQFGASRPETQVILIDKGEKIGSAQSADLAIGWGRFKDDAATVAEQLTAPEEVFPVCRPGVCPDGSLAGATLLHREAVGDAWRWPDWPAFLATVGLDGAGTVGGLRLTAGLLLDAARQGKGVMLANNTMIYDDVVAGRLVRPVMQSMPTDDSYWLLTSRTERDRPEVVAFRNWLVEEAGACFGNGDAEVRDTELTGGGA